MASNFLATASEEFEREARAELKRLDSSLLEGEILTPGLFLFSSSLPPTEFLIRAGSAALIYTRHLFPVQAEVPLQDAPSDLALLGQKAAELVKAAGLPPATPFSVQARIIPEGPGSYRPFDLKTALAGRLSGPSGLTENIKNPAYIISLVCAPGRAFLGLSRPAQNLSDWAGGMRHYAKRPEQISRAEFKLLEALEVFQLKLPARGRALDLGAAPGGWTRILLEAKMLVTAVDPADLDSRFQAEPGLENFRGYAENFLTLAKRQNRQFEVICSDIRMDALAAARLMVEFAPLFAPAGFSIITLKLPHPTRKLNPATLVSRAIEILSPVYQEVKARQLFHNRQEVTVLLRKPEKS